MSSSLRPLASDWREAGITDALNRIDLAHGQNNFTRQLLCGSLAEVVVVLGADSLRHAAALRVVHGAQLEAHATRICTELWPIEAPAAEGSAQQRARVCGAMFDAYAAAVWTSAHAEYVAMLDAGLVEPPLPCLSMFPSASSGKDLGDLFARRLNPRTSGMSKETESLVSLLARCTNPGARGWSTVLETSLANAPVRPVVIHAIVVCLTGMHPQLHPGRRPVWTERMKIHRAASLAIQDKAATLRAAVYIKEAVRRCLASTMSVHGAMHAALSCVGHPCKHLHQPPLQLPHSGMQAAMVCYAEAGMMLAESGAPIDTALASAFSARKSDKGDGDAVVWDSSWMGASSSHSCLHTN